MMTFVLRLLARRAARADVAALARRSAEDPRFPIDLSATPVLREAQGETRILAALEAIGTRLSAARAVNDVYGIAYAEACRAGVAVLARTRGIPSDRLGAVAA
jgi:hypothetical protein